MDVVTEFESLMTVRVFLDGDESVTLGAGSVVGLSRPVRAEVLVLAWVWRDGEWLLGPVSVIGREVQRRGRLGDLVTVHVSLSELPEPVTGVIAGTRPVVVPDWRPV